MKLGLIFVRAAVLAALCGLIFLICAGGSDAQAVYRNLSDTPFRSVSSGPQSAFILDVKDATDDAEIRKAFQQKIAPQIVARNAALRQELNAMRLRGVVKKNETLDVADTVLLRQNGKIVAPPTKKTRGPLDELTFSIATGDGTNGTFRPADAADLQALVNLVYPELRDDILGHPGWSGTVTIRSLDPTLGTINEPVGATLIINGTGVEIDFPSFSNYGFRFLAMAQVVAQAFHARQRIAYDAWETGMGRAAAVAAALRLTQAGRIPAGFGVNPANGFYYTPYYDLLNQPALANNTFFPTSRANQPFQLTTLSGMLVPRLQMSSTAWLKCFIENNSFFKTFNTGTADGLGTGGYYAAYTADNTVANDVTRLRTLAASAVPNVEGDAFNAWFERQYVLNTSVTPGNKLFVSTQPTYPTDAKSNDSGAAFFVVYYATSRDGNETDLSGTSNLIYWDYTFANRLFFQSFDTVQINNGFGTVAPFFTGIGNNDQQRVAVDFPIGKETARVYFPTGQTGLETNPNNFSGVIIGADAGGLQVAFDGGSGPINTAALAGEFGGQGTGGAIPNNFTRARLTFTPTGGQAVTFQRNVFIRDNADPNGVVAPVFVLTAPGPTVTLSHTFDSGIQMLSFPVKPLSGDLAAVLGTAANQTLLAQYRQDLATSDKYLRYPNLPLYQPGNAMWGSFTFSFTANSVRGESADIQKYISIPLEFGWNQIGSPYNQNLTIGSDLQFQYLGGDALSLAEAVTQGLVAPGIFAYVAFTNDYTDINNPTDPNVPANTLVAWKGYWIRVLKTEGVTITFANPTNRSIAPRSSVAKGRASGRAASRASGWQIPLTVQDADGARSGAIFGQAPNGSDSYVPALHVAAPPAIQRGAPTLSVRFPHTDWNAGGGDGTFLTDIRRANSKSQWNLTVTVPSDAQDYTLSWSGMALLPRGTRLTLIDADTGTRQSMNTTSRYVFRPAKSVTTRSFQITAEPNSAAKLRISNLSAGLPFLPNGRAAGNVTITYEMSQSAETSVAIRLGGRVVRHLNTGRAVTAGVNQTLWDLRDDKGIALPGGTYTLEITAHSPEGEVTRAVTPLLLTR